MSDATVRRLTRRGIVRAIAADAAEQERARLLDTLQHAINARADANGRTAGGREAAGYQAAIDLLGLNTLPAEPYDELVGSVMSEVGDGVDVGVYLTPDADGAVDDWPVRLIAHDGADSTAAGAYLSVADAEALIEALGAAVRRVRDAEAASGG